MSNNGPYKKNYTFADIEKYLAGKLSASEMHAIEAAALDDPFLADAIEGYEHIDSEKKQELIKDDLEKLKEKIHRPHDPKAKTIAFSWRSIGWKAAAVLLISGTMVALTYNFWGNPDHDKVLATVSQTKPDTVNQPEITVQKAQEPIEKKEEVLKSRSYFKTRQDKKQPVPQTAETSEQESAELSDKIEPDSLPLAKSSVPQGAANNEVERTMKRKISGVAVTEKKDSSLDEVVVTGYGLLKNKNPFPKDGWDKYRQYILNNTKNSAFSAKDSTGELIVSFSVDKHGRLSDFKIEKSLSPDADARAIQLIKDGPSWKNPLRKSQRVSMPITL